MRIPPFICFMIITPLVSVTAQKTINVNGTIKTQPTEEVNLNEAAISIEYKNDEKAKFEIENKFEFAHTNSIYDIDNNSLQKNMGHFNEISNTFSIAHNIGSSTEFSATVTPTANFQENIGLNSISILGGLEIHQIIGSNSILNVGVVRSSFLGSPKIIPIVSFEQKINNHIDLTVGFPNSAISYRNNERNKFSLTNSFNGTYYNLDHTTYSSYYTNADRLRLSQMTTAVTYERNVDANWFLNFKGGYDFNRKYQITSDSGESVYDFNINNGAVFSIGITYKH